MVRKQAKLAASRIGRILHRESGALLGFVIRWNTGEEEPLWIKRRYDVASVRYVIENNDAGLTA